ncbi:hypothetical protein A9Q99_03320 [Gammaproteobacteria bacterium 45_16_T64]|nr:hypothetical protein A9Q99_03320 [Gammaproteobacteria bacterium 45_16_T64]
MVLHLLTFSTFTSSFIDLLEDEGIGENTYFILGGDERHTIIHRDNIRLSKRPTGFFERIKFYLDLVSCSHSSRKIVIHGLFDIRIIGLLFLQQGLLKKCYWVIWGGDLYRFKLAKKNVKNWVYEILRRPIIRKMGNLLTYIQGDIDLARKWYSATGKHHNCLMYHSNIYKEHPLKERELDNVVNIQLGNSADPSNNHLEILERLLPYKNENIKIYAPLSYGNPDYAKFVMDKGSSLFGDNFIPQIELLDFNRYLEFLEKIDIAIFNHDRQQAMGNIITLIGLGKKVHLKNSITPWNMFRTMGITVYPASKIELTSIEKSTSLKNINIIKNKFSRETLVKQWSGILNHE